jgi:hypothetical protein
MTPTQPWAGSEGGLLLESVVALLLLAVGGMGSLALMILALETLTETERRARVLAEAAAWMGARVRGGDESTILPTRDGGTLRWTPEGTPEGVLLDFLEEGAPPRGWIIWREGGDR